MTANEDDEVRALLAPIGDDGRDALPHVPVERGAGPGVDLGGLLVRLLNPLTRLLRSDAARPIPEEEEQ